MERTPTEAKRYLVEKTRELAERIIPDRFIQVKFSRSIRGKKVQAQAKTSASTGRTLVVVTFNDSAVEANRNNIENPLFIDMIVHELAHVPASLAEKSYFRKHHKWPETESHKHPLFLKAYETYSLTPSLKGPAVGRKRLDYGLYYGGKKYGMVPDDIRDWYLTVCQNCGYIDLIQLDESTCQRCGQWEPLVIRKATPDEVIQYHKRIKEAPIEVKQTIMQTIYGNELRRYFPKRFGKLSMLSEKERADMVSRYMKMTNLAQQKARKRKMVSRRKSTILDRAMRMVRG